MCRSCRARRPVVAMAAIGLKVNYRKLLGTIVKGFGSFFLFPKAISL